MLMCIDVCTRGGQWVTGFMEQDEAEIVLSQFKDSCIRMSDGHLELHCSIPSTTLVLWEEIAMMTVYEPNEWQAKSFRESGGHE